MQCLVLLWVTRLCQPVKSLGIDLLVWILFLVLLEDLYVLAYAIVAHYIMLLVGHLLVPLFFAILCLELFFSLLAPSSERRRLVRLLLLASTSLRLAPSLALALSSSCSAQPITSCSVWAISSFHSSFIILWRKSYRLFGCISSLIIALIIVAEGWTAR
jgi:hypothetical protein